VIYDHEIAFIILSIAFGSLIQFSILNSVIYGTLKVGSRAYSFILSLFINLTSSFADLAPIVFKIVVRDSNSDLCRRPNKML